MNNASLNLSTFRKLNHMSNGEKDNLIFKLSSDLEKYNKQIMKLAQRNSELKKSLVDYNQLKDEILKFEDALKKKDLEKLEIIKEKDDKNSKLFNKISFLENTVTINRINYEKNNISYQQKMTAFNHILHENQIYAEEKADFEKEKKIYEKKKDEEVKRYKVRASLKYEKFKKKMEEDLQTLNNNLVHANSEYISANHRLAILQNRYLYAVIDQLEKRIEELEKTNEELTRKIFETEHDLNMQKLLDKDLSKKIRENNKVIKLTRNRSMINSTSMDNNLSSDLKFKTNNFNTSGYTGRNTNTYTIGLNISHSLEKKISEYEKILEEKKYEKEKMILTNSHLKSKLSLYQNKFNGLFNFFEESLNNFCNDEEIIQNNNFYMNLDKIKNCDFNSFTKKEKYALLVLLMKYLLPLISINFNSSSNIGQDLFKTNLNIVNKKFNLGESFLNDETLRNAFLDKRNKVFNDISNPRRTQFSTSVPVLKKLKHSNFSIFYKKNKAII